MRALLLLCITTGCNAIAGIGDLPRPATDAMSDAMPDATCSAPATQCGTTCFDLATSVEHCGACDNACPTVAGGTRTCEASTCRIDVDEAMHLLWSVAAPNPYLTFWKDGTLIASDGGSQAKLISPADPPVVSTFVGLPGRPTILIPVDTSKPQVVISHYNGFEGTSQSGGPPLWNNGIHGCCGSSGDGFAADPLLRRMFTGHGVTELQTDDGATASATDTFDQHGSAFYVNASSLYLPRKGTATVVRYDRAHQVVWSRAISATAGVTVGEGAIAPDGGFIIASAAGDKLTRFTPAGATPWEIDVVSPGSPITTSSGLVIVGARKTGDPHLCAFQIANGSEAWCTPLTATVVDVIAGDDGVIYVSQVGEPTVLGLDRATGVVRYTFRNVPPPQEMVLRGGQLYLAGASSVTAIAVPAMRYDASSWPVRFHDNQRTRGTVSALDF